MIGVRAHDLGNFTVDTIDQLIKKIKFYNYNHIQLVLWKSFSDIKEDLQGLTDEKIDLIYSKFKLNNIKISVLGSYYNMISPNLIERENGLNRFKLMLQLSNRLGNSFVATETGSFNEDMSFNERNHSSEAFNIVLDSCKMLTHVAKKENSFVGIEGVYTLSIWNIDTLMDLLLKLNSKNIKFIFDPVNLINENNYIFQDELINNFFEKFGSFIEVIHFKDFFIENGKLIRVTPGKGLLNYSLLIKNMKKFNLKGILEEIPEEEMNNAINYIKFFL